MNNGLRRRYNNCGLFETPRGMSCGITAVCAITGNSPDEIITVGSSDRAILKRVSAISCRVSTSKAIVACAITITRHFRQTTFRLIGAETEENSIESGSAPWLGS